MLTQAEMDAVQFHPGWDDGREGYEWCRFDATIDRDRLLRAEITWDDDYDDRPDGTIDRYFDPELLLEVNRSVEEGRAWVRESDVVFKIDDARALEIIGADPARLLEEYAGHIRGLLAPADDP